MESSQQRANWTPLDISARLSSVTQNFSSSAVHPAVSLSSSLSSVSQQCYSAAHLAVHLEIHSAASPSSVTHLLSYSNLLTLVGFWIAELRSAIPGARKLSE